MILDKNTLTLAGTLISKSKNITEVDSLARIQFLSVKSDGGIGKMEAEWYGAIDCE